MREVNGHDYNAITRVLTSVPFQKSLPNLIIAHTVKGRGVSFMENQALWHHRAMTSDEYLRAMKELDQSFEAAQE